MSATSRWPSRLTARATPTWAAPRRIAAPAITRGIRTKLSVRFWMKIRLIAGFSSQAKRAVSAATSRAQASAIASVFQRGAR